MTRTLRTLIVLTLLGLPTTLAAQDRDTKVRNDRDQFLEASSWVYNDFAQAAQTAKLANKPLLVVLRCIP